MRCVHPMLSAAICMLILGCNDSGPKNTSSEPADIGIVSDVSTQGEASNPDWGRPEVSDQGAPVDLGRPDPALDMSLLPPMDMNVDSGSGSDAAMEPTDMDVGGLGRTPTSCGAPDQDLMPVDCTSGGDMDAQCVFSNHCFCSEGYVCASGSMARGAEECYPGDICVPEPPDGVEPDRCGRIADGMDPVDCTQHGDADAACVFGDHCLCSERFFCQGGAGDPPQRECAPSTVCIPWDDGLEGSTRYSCGADGQGLEPVDCTALGDFGAVCVFSNHCGCSDGFVCEGSEEPGACTPGQRCEPQAP